MAWSNSKIFRQYIADMIGNTAALDYDADTIKYTNYGVNTPDNDVTAANSAYAVGQWIVGNELTSGSWAAGGQALASKTVDVATADTVKVDAADLTASSVTLAAVFGGLCYDDTLTTPVADQGMSYHYYGGSQSVTAGTFTVVFHTNGLHTYTL